MDHMQSELALPNFDHQHTTFSDPSSFTTQKSEIENFPASIEVHESAMKNTILNFLYFPIKIWNIVR